MNQIITMTFMIINSFIFMRMKHPMSLGLILFIQTLLTCTYTGLMSKNFWFSYILFLIFIGGMLILFMYMSSLTSNLSMQFSFSFKNFFFMFLVLTFIYLIFDKFFIAPQNMTNNESLTMNKFNLMNMNILMLSKMFDFPNNFITILLIIYLLLTLIIVVKITNSFLGPLRKKI